MLHAGLDLSRKKLDVCLLSDHGEHLDQLAVPPDFDSLRRLAKRIEEVHHERVCAVVESMTGARLVHDTLEGEGWEVEIADAQKVKGLAPLACKTDKIDSKVLAVLSHRDLVPAIWLPDPRVREERELARFRLHTPSRRSPRPRSASHPTGHRAAQGRRPGRWRSAARARARRPRRSPRHANGFDADRCDRIHRWASFDPGLPSARGIALRAPVR
jgi:hypothetical protein